MSKITRLFKKSKSNQDLILGLTAFGFMMLLVIISTIRDAVSSR